MIILILLSIIVLLGLYGGYQKMTVMDLEKRLKEAEWIIKSFIDPNSKAEAVVPRIKKFLGVE